MSASARSQVMARICAKQEKDVHFDVEEVAQRCAERLLAKLSLEADKNIPIKLLCALMH